MDSLLSVLPCGALPGAKELGGEGTRRVGGSDGQLGAGFSGLLSRPLTARRFGDGPRPPSRDRGLGAGHERTVRPGLGSAHQQVLQLNLPLRGSAPGPVPALS